MDKKAVLLATIESALKLQPSAAPLSAEQVGELGQKLGLSVRDTLETVRQLSADEEIDMEWRGKVRGVRRKPEGASISLGPNAIYIGPLTHIQNSAVGAGAHVEVSKAPQEDLTQIVGKLTAALDSLSVYLSGATAEQQQTCRRLLDVTEATQQQLLQNDEPDKASLGRQLDEADKALGLLEKAGKLGATITPQLPLAWDMLRHAYRALSVYLGGS